MIPRLAWLLATLSSRVDGFYAEVAKMVADPTVQRHSPHMHGYGSNKARNSHG